MHENSVSREQVHAVIDHLKLTEQQAKLVLESAFPPPGHQEWRRFGEIILMTLGTLFLLSGVVFFFAYNWRALDGFTKLGIAGAGLLLAGVLSSNSKFPALVLRTVQPTVFMLVGVLIALFGQIYQTGANAYDLFLLWALFTIPIALAFNSFMVWFLWHLVVNCTVLMYTGQIVGDWFNPYAFAAVSGFNAATLTLYELIVGTRKRPGAQQWFRALATLILYAWLTIGSVTGIFREFSEPGYSLVLIMTILAVGCSYGVYRMRIKDLIPIAFSCLVAITIIFFAIIKIMGSDSTVFFVGGFVIIGLTTFCVFFLHRIHVSWRIREAQS
jgi:uncharacterized membrane protein